MEHAYYVNPATGEILRDVKPPWLERMGPYATREEAEHAWDLVAIRNEQWDEQDREWDEDGEDHSGGESE